MSNNLKTTTTKKSNTLFVGVYENINSSVFEYLFGIVIAENLCSATIGHLYE